MELSITLLIIVITAITSIGALRNQNMMDNLIFYPPAISERKQWYRFFSHGIIHADAGHLIFNMYALYSFGSSLEHIFSFDCIFGRMGRLLFLILYVSALFMASFPDYIKYKDSYHFKSLGASGAVSAVIFSSILFFPQNEIFIFFIPKGIPGWLFGILYLGISVYLDRRGGGRINHAAHFWGAAYGIIITILFCQFFAHNFSWLDNIKEQIRTSSKFLTIYCN